MMPGFVRAATLPLLAALLLHGPASAQNLAQKPAQNPGEKAPIRRTEYLVFSQCKPGLKEQCDRWYAKHIRDLMKIEGMLSAQQYALVPGRGGMAKDKDRLVVYQLEGDPEVVLARLRPAVTEGRLEAPDPALFEMTFQTAVVEKVGPAVKAGR
jgi:hypothetical protein